jgi:20S proteasome alpha/beta subunit
MVYSSATSQEQFDAMTFQIGIARPTGVILASDLKHTSLYGIDHSSLSSKIRILESGKVAYCHAGDIDYSNILATDVKKAISKSTLDFASGIVRDQIAIRDVLIDCAAKAKRKHAQSRKQDGADKIFYGHTLFVFCNQQQSCLWSVESSTRVPDASLIVSEYVTSGNTKSPAVFFPEHYINDMQSRESLISLAVHTVLMAEGDYVEGVEVGIFSPDRFELLSKPELDTYIEKSKQLDTAILKTLTGANLKQ